MRDRPPPRGLYVPLITPYADDGSVELEALERLGHECIDAGAEGLVALATTGEYPLLDAEEKRAVTKVCAGVCVAREAELIVGAGTNSTRATIADVEALRDVAGVSAALCVVPYYLRPSQAGIVAHFEAVAAAGPVPIVIYNIPYRTGRLLEPEGMLRLANAPNIVGVKQAVGGIEAGTERVLAESPPRFAVLGGDDPYLFPLTLLGGAGAIAASAHVCTSRFAEMIDEGLAGNRDAGRLHHEALLPVVQACFAEPSPAVIKGILHAQGRISTPDVRLPLVNASAEAVERALQAIASGETQPVLPGAS